MEAISQEEDIILASARKLVSLGVEASEKSLNGYDCSVEDIKAEKILRLLTAYRNKASMSRKQLEAILYCLRKLSGFRVRPTFQVTTGIILTEELDNILMEDSGDILIQ